MKFEDRQDLYNYMKEQELLKQQKKNKQYRQLQEKYDNIINEREQKEEKRIRDEERYIKFREAVPTRLLEITLNFIMSKTLKEEYEPNKVLVNNLIHNYIKETGYYNILNTCETSNTLLLSEMYRLISEAKEKIFNRSNEDDPESQVFLPDDEEDFYESLEDEGEFEDIANIIAMRVANAEEEFVTQNIEDKMRTEEIIGSAQNRIDAIKQDLELDDEDKEEYTEEQADLCNTELHDIIYNRDRSVYEQLVLNLFDSIMKNTQLSEAYSISGRIDTDKVIDRAKIIYTMMEMLNTTQLEKYTEDSIIETIENI